jgi:hypothetical protein
MKAYIIKRDSRAKGAVLADYDLALTMRRHMEVQDFENNRGRYRDLVQYQATHLWSIEETEVVGDNVKILEDPST